jgi:hypothetical protein
VINGPRVAPVHGNDGRPSMLAAGISGGMIGHRADYLIFDDLIKSQSDAYSGLAERIALLTLQVPRWGSIGLLSFAFIMCTFVTNHLYGSSWQLPHWLG